MAGGSADVTPEPASSATPHGLRQVYVYWKTASPEQTMTAARAAQSELRHRHSGLQTELLRRQGSGEPLSTIMEIYRYPQGVDVQMQAEIDARMQLTLQTWLASPRKVEVFLSPAP